jgi:anti-sigma B factor antagonist
VKPLTVTSERDGDGARVLFQGELDIAGAPEAEKAIRAVEDDRPASLTIDLSGLTFMDSTGLRLVVAADRRARENGRTLRIVRGPAAVQRVFELTGLEGKLPIVDA